MFIFSVNVTQSVTPNRKVVYSFLRKNTSGEFGGELP